MNELNAPIDMVRKIAEKLAREKYPDPAHGPNVALVRIARNAFIDGYVTRVEQEKSKTVGEVVGGR